MKKIIKSLLLLMTVTFGAVSLGSCSDDDLPEADALFRPIISEDDNIEHGLDGNSSPYMIITWDKYTNANQYVVRIEASDGSDTREITTDTTVCRFDNLQYDRDYNVSISAANTLTGLSSKSYTLTTTSLDFPTSLITPTTNDIIDIQARIRWAIGVVYDKLVIINDTENEIVAEVVVTDADNELGQKIISGLDPHTTYRVEAYYNGAYQGKKRLTTVASENYSGNVVDLRGVEKSDGFISSEHMDSLISLYPDQDITIVLEGGNHYKYQTVNLSSTTGTIKFVTGLTLAGNAVFDCSGELNVPNGVSVGGVEYEKVFFADNAGNKTSSNYGGHYLLNVNTSGHIDNLVYRNCEIKYKRGGIRARNTFTIENLTFDDCVIDSIGGYGIAMCENSACITNITMKNTTAANCNRTLVNTVTTAGDITIENCTFVYCVASNRNFDDVKTCNSFSIKKCVFGISGETPAKVVSEGTDAVGFRGWVSGAAPVPTTSDCFFTSDVAWRLTAEGTPAAQLDGTTWSTDTKGTFKNPEASDFTLISAEAIKAKAGDPRWIP